MIIRYRHFYDHVAYFLQMGKIVAHVAMHENQGYIAVGGDLSLANESDVGA